MSLSALRELFVLTLTAPRTAAAQIVMLRPGRDVLWQALLLIVVLNALVFGISNLVTPPVQPLPPMMSTPFLFGLTLVCGLVIVIFGLFWTGAWLGGQGALEDLLILIVWLQALCFAVQVAATLLILISPGLAAMLLSIVSILGLWILLNFIDVAHRFNSFLKAFGTLALTVLGIAMGLVLILSMIGVTSAGLTPNV